MNTNLPELVGTLANLPVHARKAIEEYGKACAAVAVKQYKESLVVELPQAYVDYDMDDNPCKFFTKKQVTHMLQSAGINYREKE